jgi:hypothetical protein
MSTGFSDFVHAYTHFADGNEAPPIFHKWGALATISSVMSRRIWFDQQYYKIYPNMYIVFVGEPGDKKTTALSISRRFSQLAFVPVAPPSITKEAMTKLLNSTNDKSPHLIKITKVTDEGEFLEEVAQMSLYASEIVTMLSAGGNPIGIVDFLTDIFDRDVFEVVTKNQGTDVIKNPYITLLGCMTPEQTGQMLKQTIITGGFSRRCIFVFGRSKTTGVPFPELTESQKAAEAFLIESLTNMRKVRGEFKMSPAAKDHFIKWYHAKHRQLQQPGPAATKNWLRSKDVQAIKVAMLLTVSQFDESRIISIETLRKAIEMLDNIEPDLGKVFSGAGRNIANELAEKIILRIEETPQKTLPKKQLLALMFSEGSYQELNDAFNFLIETGKVRKVHPPGKTHVEMLTTQMEGNPDSSSSS